MPVLRQVEGAGGDGRHPDVPGHPLASEDVGPGVQLRLRPQGSLVHLDAGRLQDDAGVAENKVPTLRRDRPQADLPQHLHEHVALALHHLRQPREVAFLLRVLEGVRGRHLQRRGHAEVHGRVRREQRSCQRRGRDDVAHAPTGARECLAGAEERHRPLEHPGQGCKVHVLGAVVHAPLVHLVGNDQQPGAPPHQRRDGFQLPTAKDLAEG
mmetsp:Transcript_12502/g.39423  ORF Transcript_12502/g.39423 Transcript_12502/m.39423 type:complete len:211 (-) Transcript_12502:671-1303(-)